MVRKPAKMYRNLAKKAYTRREYMGGVPGSKIVQFDMGNLTEDFPVELSIVAEEACQIRHTALEAARIGINRQLQKEVGRANFHLKIRTFPHHVLRENKQAQTVSRKACASPSGRPSAPRRGWIRARRSSPSGQARSMSRRPRSRSGAAYTNFRLPQGSSKSRRRQRKTRIISHLFSGELPAGSVSATRGNTGII